MATNAPTFEPRAWPTLGRTADLPPLASGARPILGHLLEFARSPESVLQRGHREHGRIFRLRMPGRACIVMLGPDHTKFLFGQRDDTLSIRRSYPFLAHMFATDVYFLADPGEYLRQREIVLPRFRSRNMGDYIGVMEEEVLDLVTRLGGKGELELNETVSQLVMGITTRCFLGDEADRELKGLYRLFREFARGLDPLLPGWVPAPHMVRCHRAGNQLRAVIQRLIDNRRAQPLESPDFLQILGTARYPDGRAVPDHIVTNLALLLAWVGHETTSGHLSWALVDLLQNPAELTRARAEAADVLDSSGGRLDAGAVRRLAHLDRALHETERLHPVEVVIRRAEVPLEHAGYRIPKGSIVIGSPGLTHRLPDVFPDPDRYRPDRFLENPSGLHALIGFGGGLHRCLGMNFAYTEMKVAVSRLLQHLDLELVDTDPRPRPGPHSKWPQSPCRVRYRRRNGAGGPQEDGAS